MVDSNIKSKIKNIGFMGFANIFGAIISGLFWLYIASLMGVENYGQIGFLMGVAGIGKAIAIWGSDKALTVLTAKNINIQSTIYIISFVTTAITAIALYFMLDSIGLSVFLVGAIIFNLVIAETLGRKQYSLYSKYILLQKVLFIILGILFYYLIGPEGVLVGFGFSCLPFSYRIYQSLKNNKFNFKILKKKFGFITNNYINDLVDQFAVQIDKIIIGPIFGFMLLGNYYFAMQIFNMLSMVPEIVAKYTLPEDSSGVSTKKIKILTIIISVLLALTGIFVVPIVIAVYLPDYSKSLEIIPIISLAIIPTTITSMYTSKFFGNEQSKIVLISSIILIIILVPGIIILGETMGIMGLAVIFVISEIIKSIFLVIADIYLEKRKSFL